MESLDEKRMEELFCGLDERQGDEDNNQAREHREEMLYQGGIGTEDGDWVF